MLAALSLSPTSLIDTFGLIGILALVFAKSGLLIGFFLPGDSLLFTTGLLSRRGRIYAACRSGCSACWSGSPPSWVTSSGTRSAGGSVRRCSGVPTRGCSNRRTLARAGAFFAKYGARSIVLARFVPIVRTFTPIVAGASRMHYRTFLIFNVVGGGLWGCGVTMLGYFLGQVDLIANHLELAILAVVALSASPLAFEIVRARRERGRDAEVERLG